MKGKVLKKVVALMCAACLILSSVGFAGVAQRAAVVEQLSINDTRMPAKMKYPVLKYQDTLYYALDDTSLESFGITMTETDQAIELGVTGFNRMAYTLTEAEVPATEKVVMAMEKALWIDGMKVQEKSCDTPLLRQGNTVYFPITESVVKAMHWKMEVNGDRQFVIIPTKTELAQIRSEKPHLTAVSNEVNKAILSFKGATEPVTWTAEQEPDVLLNKAASLVETADTLAVHMMDVREVISAKVMEMQALEAQVPDKKACEQAYYTRLAEVTNTLEELKQEPVIEHDGLLLRTKPGFWSRQEEAIMAAEDGGVLVYMDYGDWEHYTATIQTYYTCLRETQTSNMGWVMDYSNRLFYGEVDQSLDPKGFGVKYFADKMVIGTYDTTDEAINALTVREDGVKWYEWLGENKELLRLTIQADGRVLFGPQQKGLSKNGAFYTLQTDGTLTLQEYINGYAYPTEISQKGDRIHVTDKRKNGYVFAVKQGEIVELAQAEMGDRQGMAYRLTGDGVSYWGPVDKGLATAPENYRFVTYGADQWGPYIDRQVNKAFSSEQDMLVKLSSIATFGKQLLVKSPGQPGYTPMADTGVGTLLTMGGTTKGRLEALSLILTRAGIEHKYMTAAGVEHPWIIVKTADGVLHMDIANVVEQTVMPTFSGFAAPETTTAVPQNTEDGLYTTEEMLQRLSVAPVVAESWAFSEE